MPVVLALFTFVLVNNIFGLIPFVRYPAMARIGFPVALAMIFLEALVQVAQASPC